VTKNSPLLLVFIHRNTTRAKWYNHQKTTNHRECL
jgi:hypothetical protein